MAAGSMAVITAGWGSYFQQKAAVGTCKRVTQEKAVATSCPLEIQRKLAEKREMLL